MAPHDTGVPPSLLSKLEATDPAVLAQLLAFHAVPHVVDGKTDSPLPTLLGPALALRPEPAALAT